MYPETTIASAAAPISRIVGSTIENAAPASLPSRSLGLGPYTPQPLGDGRAQLRDAAGNGWGIFASESLASQTASALSR